MKRKLSCESLVILDRDGVINQDSDSYIKSVDEWNPIPGSLEAIAKLYHSGLRVVVATNQSGLARGFFSIDDLNAMHRKMRRELSVHGAQIEAIFFCPHTPATRCKCRKPMPGLLADISRRLKVDLVGVPLIGDSIGDIRAAKAVSAKPILVRTGKGERTIEQYLEELGGISIYSDLSAAAESLLAA